MESNWFRFMKHCKDIYGIEVNLEDRFFRCPECEDVIYEEDWTDEDYWLGRKYKKKWYCPICENLLAEF